MRGTSRLVIATHCYQITLSNRVMQLFINTIIVIDDSSAFHIRTVIAVMVDSGATIYQFLRKRSKILFK